MVEMWLDPRTNRLAIQSHTRGAPGTRWAALQTVLRVCLCFRRVAPVPHVCALMPLAGASVSVASADLSVGRLIACCGETAEGPSKAQIHPGGGGERKWCRICLQRFATRSKKGL